MRQMFDAVDPARIPADAAIVAGYVDGLYAWSAADWTRFPRSLHVPISVSAADNQGIVLDVERGDATPDQAVAWVQRRRASGQIPTVYCAASTWGAVRQAFQTAHVGEPLYWIADWNDQATLLPGSIAHQYRTTPGYDVSVVATDWPGVDPVPRPASVSATTGYVLVGSDGGVFTFGTARFFGSLAGHALNKPIVGLALRPQRDGYWLAAADGGVFTFGAAPFHGSRGGHPLNKPVVGIAAAPDGNGYTLFAADGGVFTFGSAAFVGSMGGETLAAPVVGGARW